MMFPLGICAESGYVGDSFDLESPKPPSYQTVTRIKSVTWSGQYADGLSSYETSSGLHVTITSYFEWSKTISCQVTYEWVNAGYTNTSTVRKSWSISCKAVNIDASDMTMKVGEKQYISYSVTPNATVTFRTNDYNVADVSSSGEVTAKAVGTAIITLSTGKGPDETCRVEVTQAVEATAITLPSEKSVDVYSSITLQPTIEPSEASPQLTWTSDDQSIAQVDNSGKVTGENPGTTTIRVTTDNGLSASCAVTVNDIDRTPRTFDIADESSQKTLHAGEMWSVPYSVNPWYANYTVKWSSSDESVATVSSSGLVVAKKQGKARITGQIEDRNLTDYCDVTVVGIPNVFSVWLASGQRMDIKLDKNIKLTYKDGKIIINSDDVNVEYDELDVKKYSLESDGTNETGVHSIPSAPSGGGITYEGNQILLKGFTPGSAVQVFAPGGQAESNYRIGADGSLSISIDSLSKGIHIIKTESITYKIIRK